MPYSTKNDVLMYGQFANAAFGSVGWDEEATYQKAINDADHMIDDYCNVPEQFFTAGGTEIQQEHHNGTDVVYIGGIIKFFNWYYGATSHLKLKYKPVLSVTKLEEETSPGTWTERTEGSSGDYIVVDDGVRFVQNTPAWKFKNVRATYKAGYTITPWQVQQVSAELAARILQDIEDRKNRDDSSPPGMTLTSPAPKPVFSDELKNRLNNYRRVIYAFG
jgi:hypothetical protein